MFPKKLVYLLHAIADQSSYLYDHQDLLASKQTDEIQADVRVEYYKPRAKHIAQLFLRPKHNRTGPTEKNKMV